MPDQPFAPRQYTADDRDPFPPRQYTPDDRDPAPIVVETEDTNLRNMRELYDTLKVATSTARQRLEELEEQFKAVKTAIEGELYTRTQGARLVDLRVRGIDGALRMRQKFAVSVDRDRLRFMYPEVYEKVERRTPYWELRQVK